MKNIGRKLERWLVPSRRNNWRPDILKPKNLFKLAVILLIIKFVIFSWFYYFPKTTYFSSVVSSELVEMVNRERAVLGLKPLVVNQRLLQAAQDKAQDMLAKDYFAHTSPIGLSPWFWIEKAGYRYIMAGENLAKDFTESEYVHQAWMNSSSHRANILNKSFQEIGIAVMKGELNGEETILAVQFFGLSAKVPTSVGTEAEQKPLVVSDIKIEMEKPLVKGEEIGLKGPQVFKQQPVFKQQEVFKPEPFFQKIYFIVLALIGLILTLTIFINIRVQYPKVIFATLVFLILVAAIALFNGQEFLNKGLDILSR